MTFLLDTDTVIHMMRGLSISSPRTDRQRQRQTVGRKILATCREKSASGHQIALSAITVAELEYGACGADDPVAERSRMYRFLSPFEVHDFEAKTAAPHYGAVRYTLETSGRTIGPNDLLIAAHALALGATMVTNNTTEYQRVEGLKCENWVRSE